MKSLIIYSICVFDVSIKETPREISTHLTSNGYFNMNLAISYDDQYMLVAAKKFGLYIYKIVLDS